MIKLPQNSFLESLNLAKKILKEIKPSIKANKSKSFNYKIMNTDRSVGASASGYSKIRAGVFNKGNKNEAFYAESEFFTDQLNLESEIQKIIASFEKDTNEYIDNINLMIDSPKMLSIGISLSKKLDGSNLKKTNIQKFSSRSKTTNFKNIIKIMILLILLLIIIKLMMLTIHIGRMKLIANLYH